MSKPNYRMNSRMVVARFWGNEELAELVTKTGIPNLQLTMIGLWGFADETGIFEWKPRVAASYIYPLLPEFQPQVELAMNAFVEAGMVKKIEVDGSWYGYFPHWKEHNSFRANKSRYPAVAIQLGLEQKNPVQGSIPLHSPQEPSDTLKKPLETELETELEVKLVSESESEKRAPQGEQEKNAPSDSLEADIVSLCDLISDYSGNAVKPDWAKYAKAILKVVPLDKLKPLLEWMYVESDFWGKRTFNTKNLFDHLQEGNLLKKYNAERSLQKKKVEKAKSEVKTSAPGAHGNFSGMEF